MNSDRPRHIAIWLILVFAGAGCTIDQPFEAGFTTDEDWIPSIQLAQNDYRRVVLNIDRPPRLSLLRNIDRYRVLIQTKQDLSIVKLDTIPGSWISPDYLFPSYPHPYYSGPVLNHEAEYRTQVDVFYKSGSRVSSNTIDFISPPPRGAITKEFPLPQKVPGSMWSFEDVIAFHNDELIVLRDDQVFRIDTVDGKATLLKDQFLPPEDYPNKTFRSIAMTGDTLITFYFHWQMERTTIVHLSLGSSVVDSSVTVSFPNASPLAVVSFDGSVLFHLLKAGDQQQFVKVEPQTGRILHEFPPFPWAPLYLTDVSSQDQTIWVSGRKEYDNRLIQIDPSNGAVIKELPNPVFRPQGLTFDGSHFWQIDTEMQKIVKVRPAGF